MKIIDWNKAPENATHAVQLGDRVEYVWQKPSDQKKVHAGGFSYHACYDEDATSTDYHMRRDGWKIVSARGSFPLIHRVGEVFWSGEGLPPVGTVCEYDARPVGKGDPLWVTVKINYLSEWTIVFQCIAVSEGAKQENIGVELAEMADASTARRFRQTRTPEQIAAEEREDAIQLMLSELKNTECLTSHYEVCESLYQAGYRKQVTK